MNLCGAIAGRLIKKKGQNKPYFGSPFFARSIISSVVSRPLPLQSEARKDANFSSEYQADTLIQRCLNQLTLEKQQSRGL
jgi:hypothetical protein